MIRILNQLLTAPNITISAGTIFTIEGGDILLYKSATSSSDVNITIENSNSFNDSIAYRKFFEALLDRLQLIKNTTPEVNIWKETIISINKCLLELSDQTAKTYTVNSIQCIIKKLPISQKISIYVENKTEPIYSGLLTSIENDDIKIYEDDNLYILKGTENIKNIQLSSVSSEQAVFLL